MSGDKYRYDRPVAKADDPLPTADVVALAKGFTAKACAEKAAVSVWTSPEHAKTWINRAPFLALLVLERLCPTVPAGRLAMTLGLDPALAPQAARAMIGRGHGNGAVEEGLVDGICREVLGPQPGEVAHG